MSLISATVYSKTGTAIATAYSAGTTPMNVGRASRVRFTVVYVSHASSTVATVTFKLQQRFNDGTTTSAYKDLPSNLDDASDTREVEHAFTLGSAGTTSTFTFYLKDPQATCDITVNGKGNAAGHASDTVVVYAVIV